MRYCDVYTKEQLMQTTLLSVSSIEGFNLLPNHVKSLIKSAIDSAFSIAYATVPSQETKEAK